MNTPEENTPLSREELDYRIGSQQEKLLDLKKRLQTASEQFKKAEATGKEGASFKESLAYLEEQYRQAEKELVALLKQRQQEIGKDAASIEEGAAQLSMGFESASQSEETLRSLIAASIGNIERQQELMLQAKLTEAHQLLGDSQAFKILLKAARDPDNSDERDNCIIELRKLGELQVLEPLLGFLEVKGDLGFWAGSALAWVYGKEVVLAPLLFRLQNSSPVVREQAIHAVECLGRTPRFANPRDSFELRGFLVTGGPVDDRLLEPLLGMLKDEHPKVRARAVSALCHLGDHRATPELVKALEDPAKEVRVSAAAFLGSFGDEQAIEPLVKAMQSGDKDIEGRARQSLAFLGYEEASQSMAAEIFKAFGAKDQTQAEELAQEFSDLNALGNQEGINRLFQGLFSQKLAPEGLAPLLEKLKDPISSARADAATRLGFLKDKAAVEPLIEALGDKDLMVRNNVIMALGQLKDSRAVEPLLALLAKEKEPHTCSLVSHSLALINDKRAVEPLLALFEDNSVSIELTGSVVYALGELGDRRAYQPVVKLVQDSQAKTILSTTLVTLGKLGAGLDTLEEEVLQILLDKLKNGDLEERMAAAQGLGYLGDKRALPDLEWAKENDPH
jgi:HEAT repeat protein